MRETTLRLFGGLVLGAAIFFAFATGAFAASWSAPHSLSATPSGPAYNPAVAMGPDGTTVVVWDQLNTSTGKYSVEAGIRKPGGPIAIFPLGTSVPAAVLSVAVGGNGTIAVAWEHPAPNSLENVQVRIRRPGERRFEQTVTLSGNSVSTNHGAGDFPRVAVDDVGAVYVVWEEYHTYSGQVHFRVAERHRRTDGAWTSLVFLSAHNVDSHGARVAADGNGHVAVSWSQGAIEARIQPGSASAFGFVQKLSSSPADANTSVGESDHGRTLVVWEQAISSNVRIESKLTPTDTFPNSGQYLSPAGSASQDAALASNGQGIAAWEYRASSVAPLQVQAATLPATSTHWGGLTTLTPSGYTATSGSTPSVAIDQQRAIIGWSENQGSTYYVAVRVHRAGFPFQPTKTFPGPGGGIQVAVPNDGLSTTKVLGALIWTEGVSVELSTLS